MQSARPFASLSSTKRLVHSRLRTSNSGRRGRPAAQSLAALDLKWSRVFPRTRQFSRRARTRGLADGVSSRSPTRVVAAIVRAPLISRLPHVRRAPRAPRRTLVARIDLTVRAPHSSRGSRMSPGLRAVRTPLMRHVSRISRMTLSTPASPPSRVLRHSRGQRSGAMLRTSRSPRASHASHASLSPRQSRAPRHVTTRTRRGQTAG